jgi:hypothetical protein
MWQGIGPNVGYSLSLEPMRLISFLSAFVVLLLATSAAAQAPSSHDQLRQQTNQLLEVHGKVEDQLANLRKIERALYEAHLFQKRKQDVSDVSISQVLSRSTKAANAIDKFLAAMTVYVEITDDSNRKRIAPKVALLRVSTLLDLDTCLEDVQTALRHMTTAPTANANAKEVEKELRVAQKLIRGMTF